MRDSVPQILGKVNFPAFFSFIVLGQIAVESIYVKAEFPV